MLDYSQQKLMPSASCWNMLSVSENGVNPEFHSCIVFPTFWCILTSITNLGVPTPRLDKSIWNHQSANDSQFTPDHVPSSPQPKTKWWFGLVPWIPMANPLMIVPYFIPLVFGNALYTTNPKSPPYAPCMEYIMEYSTCSPHITQLWGICRLKHDKHSLHLQPPSAYVTP